MSYHGAVLNGEIWGKFLTKAALTAAVEHTPHDVIITKTEPRQYAGPLTLGPEKIAVGGPDPKNPSWIVIIKRQPDGSWSVISQD